MFLGFPYGSAGKESACNAGDLGLIPGLGRSPGERNSYPLQYFGLENSMDCIVQAGRKELDTTERLLLFTFTANKKLKNSRFISDACLWILIIWVSTACRVFSAELSEACFS